MHEQKAVIMRHLVCVWVAVDVGGGGARTCCNTGMCNSVYSP